VDFYFSASSAYQYLPSNLSELRLGNSFDERQDGAIWRGKDSHLTNLFLRFRTLSKIDWCGFIQVGVVEIKAAGVVTRELEDQKATNQSPKLRERGSCSVETGARLIEMGVLP
jgi:hypothetical protein